ncbi:MAG: septal ring lytic transglycosylase RlpA family protein [Massilia sp.]
MAVLRLLPAVVALAVLMTGCGTPGEHRLIPLPWPHRTSANHPKLDPSLPALPAAGSGRGGYYQDDGPGANPPPNLRDVPDAEVRYEPYAKYGNRPYSVFGQTYTPLLNDEPFSQRGVASWYGVKFHGQRTSSGEPYDMYKMTAAHPTLPIPSFARVTSLESGKSVIVRINDRGPFHSDRVIDVSYTAALKLGLLGKGSHEVEVERLFAGDSDRIANVRRAAASQAQALPSAQIAALMLEDRADGDSGTVAPAPRAAPKGFYIQLGAFTRAGKAEEMRQRLAQNGVDAGTLEVTQAGSVQRLYSGPFATRELALQTARALPASLGLKPVIVKR